MDKIKNTIKKITDTDKNLMQDAQKRLDCLTKPQGSLGRLEELAKKVVGITGKENPSLRNKVIFTLASDHGVVEEKISAFPQEVTSQMVYNFLNGGAGISVLSRHIGARVVVVDMGVARRFSKHFGKEKFKDKKINFGTKNFTNGPAMTKDEAIKSIETGIVLVEEELKEGIDIMGTGDMGIGNTTSSSTICYAITGKDIKLVTGRGTGISDETLENKIRVIEKAIKINKPNSQDGIDVLAKVGGFEIGGLVGLILAAASFRIPVVIDGFISGAASLIAYTLEPKVRQYMIASHCSAEPGHKIILDYLGLKPLLNLDMRLGEGTGAVLGINLVEAGVKILTEMATFKKAGVSERNN